MSSVSKRNDYDRDVWKLFSALCGGKLGASLEDFALDSLGFGVCMA